MCWHGSNVLAQHVARRPGGLAPSTCWPARGSRRRRPRRRCAAPSVWKCSLHLSRPRLSASRPARSSRKRPVSPTRPTLNSTVSPSSRLPLSSSTATQARLRLVDVDDAFAQAEDHAQRAGVVQQRFDDFAGRRIRAVATRPSTTVTCTPSVANMMAYSRPITPPPTTIIDRGMLARLRISSESKTVSPLNGMWSGRAGPGAGGEQDVLGFERSAARRGR